jgi:hypothetical protein
MRDRGAWCVVRGALILIALFPPCFSVSAWAQTPIGTYIVSDSQANAALVGANAALDAAKAAQATAATNKQTTDQQLSAALAQLGPGASVYVMEADNSITVYSVDATGTIVAAKPFPSSTAAPVAPTPTVTPSPPVTPPANSPQLKRPAPVVPPAGARPAAAPAKTSSTVTIRETVTVHIPYSDPDSFHSRSLSPSNRSRLALSGR